MKLSEILAGYDLSCKKFEVAGGVAGVCYNIIDNSAMNIFDIESNILYSVASVIECLDNFISEDLEDIRDKYYGEDVPYFNDVESAIDWLRVNHPSDSYIEFFECIMDPSKIEDDLELLSEQEVVAGIYNEYKMSIFEYRTYLDGYNYILDNHSHDVSALTILETILGDEIE